MKLRIIFCVFLLLSFSCEKSSADVEFPDNSSNDEVDNTGNEEPDYSILFIGNSLTYYNDLPNLVKNIAFQNNIIIATKTIAIGNYALIDHWDDGFIQIQIESGKFDYVVIQQGPSSQDYGRDLLFEAGDLISDLCRSHNAKLAFYMV